MSDYPYELGTGFVDCEQHPFSEGGWRTLIPLGRCPICERERLREQFGPKEFDPDRVDMVDLS